MVLMDLHQTSIVLILIIILTAAATFVLAAVGAGLAAAGIGSVSALVVGMRCGLGRW